MDLGVSFVVVAPSPSALQSSSIAVMHVTFAAGAFRNAGQPLTATVHGPIEALHAVLATVRSLCRRGAYGTTHRPQRPEPPQCQNLADTTEILAMQKSEMEGSR